MTVGCKRCGTFNNYIGLYHHVKGFCRRCYQKEYYIRKKLRGKE